ncbi:hypothetical protein [Umezawaea sp. Da 62-37]|uniref:hypothetical protein n=1 Tax=Umezawaea sp. Da 62-37 TaxID=3075927 RepID=UPI0028F70B4B|nr:hypothetical protein [Umezawaea sp. Da 62-37]WNV87799.1 hypothetical protein RM788_05810 [Umezawaea sp. Da 62-37]
MLEQDCVATGDARRVTTSDQISGTCHAKITRSGMAGETRFEFTNSARVGGLVVDPVHHRLDALIHRQQPGNATLDAPMAALGGYGRHVRSCAGRRDGGLVTDVRCVIGG